MTIVHRFLVVCLFAIAVLGPWDQVPATATAHLTIPAIDNDDADKGKQDEENKDKDKKDKDEKEKEKENKKDKGKSNDKGKVEASAPYIVEVICESGQGSQQTACTFTSQAPEGGKKVNHVVLPEEEICSPVVGGDAEYVAPDPTTRVVGYKSRGSTGRITLEFAAEVTTRGNATYWVKAGNNVLPARGPGLVCTVESPTPTPTPMTIGLTPLPTAGQPTVTPTATPTPELTDTTGAILVETYACPTDTATAPADTTDWFSICKRDAADPRFRLTLVGTTDTGEKTATTDDQGRARFGALAPGIYALALDERPWCHAESDGVNDEGKLVVRAGERVTVWIFVCGETSAK